jgi:hypothetical protein
MALTGNALPINEIALKSATDREFGAFSVLSVAACPIP